MPGAARRSVGIAAAVLLISTATSAKVDVHTTLGCPAGVDPKAMAELEVTLTNGECSPHSVRLMSALVANAGQTANGSSVLGPVVMWETVVPAANCQTFTPAVLNFSPLNAPPAVPLSIAGTLASYLVVSEWAGGAKTETQRCLIPVPEPSATTQGVSGVLGLMLLSRLRRRSAVPRREGWR